MKHEQYDANGVYPMDDIIRQAATDTGASYDLLRKVGWVESRFNNDAVSPTGPVGSYQFTKATGRGTGLTIGDGVDARKDPKKAAYAAGRLLKQLTDKYHGDELKAALAYNQGENSTSIHAYDAGDLNGVAAEGLGYMKSLMDVAKSPNTELVKGCAGITPKAKPFEVSDYLKGPQEKPVDTASLPQTPDLDLKAKAPEEHKSFTQLQTEYNQAHPQEPQGGFLEQTATAVKSNLENSVLGMGIRGMTGEYGGSVLDFYKPVRSGEFEPKQEDFDRWEKMGIDPNRWGLIAGGDIEHMPEREQIALKNQKMDEDTAKVGTVPKIIGSVAGALGDPLTAVPVAGELKGLTLIGKVAKVGLETAAINTASEAWRTKVAGGDADYKGAILGGLLLGGALGGVMHKLGGVDEATSLATRVEARETALNTGTSDITVKPNPEMHSEHAGVAYGDATHEPDAAVLQDGSVVDADSFVNPKGRKAAREYDVYESGSKAAAGVKLGGLTEMGQRILTSESEEMRKLGSNWFRPPTGSMEEGGVGVARMTVDDIHKWASDQDHATYSALYSGYKDAMKLPEFTHGANSHLTADEAKELVTQRVWDAIEAEDSSLHAALSEPEKKLFDIYQANFQRKADLAQDTTIFGRHDAPPVAEDLSLYRDKYTPHAYQKEKKMAAMERFGGREGLQEAIRDAWLADYRKPGHGAALDKMLKDALPEGQELTPEMVEKFLHDKAYGISHSEVFDSSAMLEEELRGGSGLENNSFLEMRVPLRTDAVIIRDGKPFKINDLRDYSGAFLTQKYNRRMNGTIAIHGATGMTELENKERILNLRKTAEDNGNRKLHQEVDTMLEAVKAVTGRARKDPDGVAETFMRSMTNLSFFAKNAYMGVQNVTEISALVNRGGLRTMLANIPMMKHLAFKRDLNPDEIKTVHALLWGKELDDSLRPSMRQTIQSLREASTAPDWVVKAAGAAKWATSEMAQRNPWTKVLKETTNTLTDCARQNVLADITGHFHNGTRSRYLNPTMLKAMSITEEQVEAMRTWMLKHSEKDPQTGKISFKNIEGMQSDPASFHLWRMGDYIASETLMRPERLSLQNAKQYGALAQMFLQFKTFTLRSLNGKTLRSWYQATKNGRAIDQAMNLVTSLGLSGMYYVAQAHAKAYSLPQEQRKAYLDGALALNSIAANTVSRSSIAGSPWSAWNIFAQPFCLDFNSQYGRSSILAQEAKEKRTDKPILHAMSSEAVQDWANGVLQQVPAANIAANAYALAHNAAGMATANSPADQLSYGAGVYNAAREFIPNDPLTQQALLHIMKGNMYVKPR